MIGHKMNGGTILAVAPAAMKDYHLVLWAADQDTGQPYVTALVHNSQFPDPKEWWTGHYFTRFQDAVDDYLGRITTDSTHFAAELVMIRETMRQKEAHNGLAVHMCAIYDLTPNECYRSTPCGDCGVRRDEHADQPQQSTLPQLDITTHAFVEPTATAADATFIDIVFDGPPSHVSGRFVESENAQGASIRAGEWIDRGNGLWALRIPTTARPNLARIAEAADTAADLAHNRLDDTSHSEYVDPAIEEKAHAQGVYDLARYLLGQEPTEALALALRAGRQEDDMEVMEG